MNPNNGNEKNHIFAWDTFKFGVVHFLSKNILKHFNDFQNQNYSVLWLKWTQVMKLKQKYIDIFFYQNELHILLTKTNVYRNNFKKDNKKMTKQIKILNNKFGMLRQHRWHIITKELVIRNQKA